MGGRTIPTVCEHGVTVDGGDFVESDFCPPCEERHEHEARVMDAALRLAKCPSCLRALLKDKHLHGVFAEDGWDPLA